jgi:DNA-binding NtrC family response regulator
MPLSRPLTPASHLFNCWIRKELELLMRPRLADLERATILRVLAECGENRARAAEKLGIGRATMHRKMREISKDSNA